MWPRDGERVSLSRRTVLVSSSIPLVLMGALSVGYLADGALQNDRVVRNVTVAGEDVSGMNRSELQSKVQELASGFPDTPVTITADALGRGSGTVADGMVAYVKEHPPPAGIHMAWGSDIKRASFKRPSSLRSRAKPWPTA